MAGDGEVGEGGMGPGAVLGRVLVRVSSKSVLLAYASFLNV